MAPVRGRVAAVLADGRQGSGYLIAPRVVLTAAHVVRDRRTARVALPDGPGERTCRVRWDVMAADLDIALLEADDDLVAEPVGPTAWGSVLGLDPLPDCQAIGFPHVQRGPGGELDSDQFICTVKPGSALIGGLLVLDGAHAAPAARADGGSPWAGLSGAAVFHDDVLLGVVRDDAHGWRHGRLGPPRSPRCSTAPRSAGRWPDRRRAPEPTPVSGGPGAFEQRYADYLAAKHGTLTIAGLDLRDRTIAKWPLRDAYLSLEATAPDGGGPDATAHPRTTLPADQALAGRRRVLLRGAAGSGKTTLVKWLAVAPLAPPEANCRTGWPTYAAGCRSSCRCAPWRAPTGCRPPADSCPPSAVPGRRPARRLGRPGARRPGAALVLVDGLDEVGEPHRDRVRLAGRLLPYTRTTAGWSPPGRPPSHDGWLADEGFAELTLSPMSRDDITAFVTRWHDAARRHGRTAGGRTPRRLPRDAAHRTATKRRPGPAGHQPPDVRHDLRPAPRPRRLPPARPQGVVRRRPGRPGRRPRPAPPPRPAGRHRTDAPAQIQLLQRLAYWLVRNGRSELTTTRPRGWSPRRCRRCRPPPRRATPRRAAPPAAAQRPAARTVAGSRRLRPPHLPGLPGRQARGRGGRHRAAGAQGADPQWEDVIRMAVAHASPARARPAARPAAPRRRHRRGTRPGLPAGHGQPGTRHRARPGGPREVDRAGRRVRPAPRSRARPGHWPRSAASCWNCCRAREDCPDQEAARPP